MEPEAEPEPGGVLVPQIKAIEAGVGAQAVRPHAGAGADAGAGAGDGDGDAAGAGAAAGGAGAAAGDDEEWAAVPTEFCNCHLAAAGSHLNRLAQIDTKKWVGCGVFRPEAHLHG